MVGEQARVYSAHLPGCGATAAGPTTTRCGSCTTRGCRPTPPSRACVEVDGSTVDAPGTRSATCSTAPCRRCRWSQQALADWSPFRMQRVGAYALVRRGDPARRRAADPVLGRGLPHRLLEPARRRPRPRRARRPRRWSREVRGGVRARPREVGELLLVHDEHFSGTAPSGRYEDFHAVSPGLRGDRARRRRAARRRGRRHHRRGGVGAAAPRSTDGSRPVLDVVARPRARGRADSVDSAGEPPPPPPVIPVALGAACS